MQIEHQNEEHRFSVVVDGVAAYVEYGVTDGALDVRHTFVPKSIGGRGIASALVAAAYRYARESGLRPAATCPYAVTWLQRHPEVAETDRS